MDFIQSEENGLSGQLRQETAVWHLFYDLLEKLESALEEGEGYAVQIAEKARQIIVSCRLN
jgi:hypothetical protein